MKYILGFLWVFGISNCQESSSPSSLRQESLQNSKSELQKKAKPKPLANSPLHAFLPQTIAGFPRQQSEIQTPVGMAMAVYKHPKTKTMIVLSLQILDLSKKEKLQWEKGRLKRGEKKTITSEGQFGPSKTELLGIRYKEVSGMRGYVAKSKLSDVNFRLDGKLELNMSLIPATSPNEAVDLLKQLPFAKLKAYVSNL